jgi:LPPG:FO 2-phospho-L-lactate transferase
MKVVALAGGVGGAKLVDGLARVLPGDDLTVIVNTGDDFDHFGLHISPDLDTVCYTLAGLANPETGWGRSGESWHAMETVEQLGGPKWFRLGDYDLGVHLERTRLLSIGYTLTEICHHFCSLWEIKPKILPMTDDRVATIVHSNEGDLAFQDYFVKRKCEPVVSGFHFEGVERAVAAPGVVQSIEAADLIVICPSNPWVSIDPILATSGVREAIGNQNVDRKVVAISPIIQGRTLKGPAAKMFSELGIHPSAASVAGHYGASAVGGLLHGFVFDLVDNDQQASIEDLDMKTRLTNTIMMDEADRIRLAEEVIQFGEHL